MNNLRDMSHSELMQRNNDILNKINLTEEPFFVLRAQDVFAASLVANWANHASWAGLPQDLVDQANEIAIRMSEWPTKKIPD